MPLETSPMKINKKNKLNQITKQNKQKQQQEKKTQTKTPALEFSVQKENNSRY